MLTDEQFFEILEPLDYEYHVGNDTIYINDEIIAKVVTITDDVTWCEKFFVVGVHIDNLADERTLALRAACVLHEIPVKEWV